MAIRKRKLQKRKLIPNDVLPLPAATFLPPRHSWGPWLAAWQCVNCGHVSGNWRASVNPCVSCGAEKYTYGSIRYLRKHFFSVFKRHVAYETKFGDTIKRGEL